MAVNDFLFNAPTFFEFLSRLRGGERTSSQTDRAETFLSRLRGGEPLIAANISDKSFLSRLRGSEQKD